MAVVDPDLRVHGLKALRVADAGVMPTVVSGNTNAACIMIGDKGADLMLGRDERAVDWRLHLHASGLLGAPRFAYDMKPPRAAIDRDDRSWTRS